MATTDFASLPEETTPAAGDWLVIERPGVETRRLNASWFTSSTGGEANLQAHLDDTSAAHAASAISASAGTLLTGTDVAAQLSQADTQIGTANTNLTNHQNSATAHAAQDITHANGAQVHALGANVQAAIAAIDAQLVTDATDLSDHEAEASGAHAASAISYSPAAPLVSTNVQAAIAEVEAIASANVSKSSHWIPASCFATSFGSTLPVYSNSGDSFGHWVMDPTVDSAIVCHFHDSDIPGDWSTFDIQVVWAALAGGTGNVRFEHTWTGISLGDVHNAVVTGGGVTAAVTGVDHTIESTTLESGASAAATAFHEVAVARMGANAADTYASNIGIQGVLLVKVS